MIDHRDLEDIESIYKKAAEADICPSGHADAIISTDGKGFVYFICGDCGRRGITNIEGAKYLKWIE